MEQRNHIHVAIETHPGNKSGTRRRCGCGWASPWSRTATEPSSGSPRTCQRGPRRRRRGPGGSTPRTATGWRLFRQHGVRHDEGNRIVRRRGTLSRPRPPLFPRSRSPHLRCYPGIAWNSRVHRALVSDSPRTSAQPTTINFRRADRPLSLSAHRRSSSLPPFLPTFLSLLDWAEWKRRSIKERGRRRRDSSPLGQVGNRGRGIDFSTISRRLSMLLSWCFFFFFSRKKTRLLSILVGEGVYFGDSYGM